MYYGTIFWYNHIIFEWIYSVSIIRSLVSLYGTLVLARPFLRLCHAGSMCCVINFNSRNINWKHLALFQRDRSRCWEVPKLNRIIISAESSQWANLKSRHFSLSCPTSCPVKVCKKVMGRTWLSTVRHSQSAIISNKSVMDARRWVMVHATTWI